MQTDAPSAIGVYDRPPSTFARPAALLTGLVLLAGVAADAIHFF